VPCFVTKRAAINNAFRYLVVATIVLLPAACGRPKQAPADFGSVGVASMDPDGTIHLQLRSEIHGGIAEAVDTVKPGDLRYAATLKHLGGLKPGEDKAIPPWP
jgi:hypothetical protein